MFEPVAGQAPLRMDGGEVNEPRLETST